MSIKGMLGRYEYTDGSSNKFWEIVEEGLGQYAATWGRIGTAGQGPKMYSEAEAYVKINEKVSKGYQKVGGMKGHAEARAAAAGRVKAKREERKIAIDFLAELKKVK